MYIFLLALLSNDLFDSRSWRIYEAHNPVVRLRLTWKSRDPALNEIFFWPERNPETTFGVGIKCIEYSDTALNVGWECGWPGNLREIPLNTASPNLARRPNQLLQLPSFYSRIGRGRKSTNLKEVHQLEYRIMASCVPCQHSADLPPGVSCIWSLSPSCFATPAWLRKTIGALLWSIFRVIANHAIPDICHGRHGYTRVNFFWPV